jgi:hypothetical protein
MARQSRHVGKQISNNGMTGDAGTATQCRPSQIIRSIDIRPIGDAAGYPDSLISPWTSAHSGTRPPGLGMMRSAPAAGACIVAFLQTRYPPNRRVGFRLFSAVAAFGIATVVFALSRSFVASLVALVVIGASDMVSVNIRTSLVQLATPDAMRGRVSAVNMPFIGASGELGAFESGVVAALFGTAESVVPGGIGTLFVAAV